MGSTTGESGAGHSVAGGAGRLELEQEVAGLRLAPASRDVIGQAKGLLMERYGLDAGRAFEVLMRLSQSSNVKLCRMAEDLIETRRLPS